jgi:hypothetical protein
LLGMTSVIILKMRTNKYWEELGTIDGTQK